ncbi:Endonuclease, Uma2 family (restriction endonuclease fold) [Methylomagnum ishizawai]|uniref:Endonuclease, Uma2 family (Restriction endonuclease fold) n=1 Tax=Methylomagnum ishizawai TaxID=1760988 RepID=A0A1Y6CWA1_9GAMM|nr:Uma2 family endonuclease [Methylomagnum ishizawai]SMF94938.1 Endonuclease, Uma2 family (restriction endonuclease fold) [Methylomagnum ishizawai]
MNVAQQRFFSAEEYLAWEERQTVKHEYLRGEVYEVYAMAGARDAHVTVAGNVFALLKSHLRGTPCRTYIADMKLRVEAADAYFYPDVFVTCDVRDRASDLCKSHPLLVVEVLSDSTSGYDRGGKFASYRRLDDLQEYVLIDPEARTVDVFRRDTTSHWVLHPYAGGAEAEFASLDFRAPLPLIFEDVVPPAT